VRLTIDEFEHRIPSVASYLPPKYLGSYFSSCLRIACKFPPALCVRFRVAHFQSFEGIKDNLRYNEPGIFLVIGRNDVPRRVACAGCTKALLVGFRKNGLTCQPTSLANSAPSFQTLPTPFGEWQPFAKADLRYWRWERQIVTDAEKRFWPPEKAILVQAQSPVAVCLRELPVT